MNTVTDTATEVVNAGKHVVAIYRFVTSFRVDDPTVCPMCLRPANYPTERKPETDSPLQQHFCEELDSWVYWTEATPEVDKT